MRSSTPEGTRSIGYLTQLLKPHLEENKFEESFATREFEIARYERDNSAEFPDNNKIAILMNMTKGAACAAPSYTRMQQQQQALNASLSGSGSRHRTDMDIGVLQRKIWQRQRKRKRIQQWKRLWLRQQLQQRYCKGKNNHNGPVCQGNPSKGTETIKGHEYGKSKSGYYSNCNYNNKGKSIAIVVDKQDIPHATVELQCTTVTQEISSAV